MIALFCPLSDLNPAYSVAGMVIKSINLLVEKGYEVMFITTNDFTDYNLLPKGVQVRTIKRFTGEDLNLSIELNSQLLRVYLQDIKICITHDIAFIPDFSWATAALIEARVKCKLLHWVHSVPGDDYREKYPDCICYNKIANSTYIFPNYSNFKQVRKRFRTNKIKVVHNWIEMDNTYNNLDYDVVCTYPTRLCGGKNIDAWISTLRKLSEKNLKVLGLLPLAYPAEDKLKELELNLEGTDSLTFKIVNEGRNTVPFEEVDKLFNISNLFLLTSYGESTSLILLEAGRKGIPCVVNKTIPCMKEFAKQCLKIDFTKEVSDKDIDRCIKLLNTHQNYVRKYHNKEWVFNNQILPLLKEL